MLGVKRVFWQFLFHWNLVVSGLPVDIVLLLEFLDSRPDVFLYFSLVLLPGSTCLLLEVVHFCVQAVKFHGQLLDSERGRILNFLLIWVNVQL